MALKVVLTSAYSDLQPISTFRERARSDRFGVHHVIDDPESADIILFVENTQWRGDVHYTRLRTHEWVRLFPEKCFMYNDRDGPWTALPGLYCSMPKRFYNPWRHRSCAYIQTQNPHIAYVPPRDASAEYLFSFMGRRIVPVRERVLTLEHPHALIRDTTKVHEQFGDRNSAAMVEYATVLSQSRFVLCPRGRGTSSFRLFETMEAGRVPVIISDQWVPPDGPDWPGFSIRVQERDVERIPDILEGLEPAWQQMALRARENWELWFAPDVLFHRMVEDCRAIQESRRVPERVMQRMPNLVHIGQRVRNRVVHR